MKYILIIMVALSILFIGCTDAELAKPPRLDIDYQINEEDEVIFTEGILDFDALNHHSELQRRESEEQRILISKCVERAQVKFVEIFELEPEANHQMLTSYSTDNLFPFISISYKGYQFEYIPGTDWFVLTRHPNYAIHYRSYFSNYDEFSEIIDRLHKENK